VEGRDRRERYLCVASYPKEEAAIDRYLRGARNLRRRPRRCRRRITRLCACGALLGARHGADLGIRGLRHFGVPPRHDARALSSGACQRTLTSQLSCEPAWAASCSASNPNTRAPMPPPLVFDEFLPACRTLRASKSEHVEFAPCLAMAHEDKSIRRRPSQRPRIDCASAPSSAAYEPCSLVKALSTSAAQPAPLVPKKRGLPEASHGSNWSPPPATSRSGTGGRERGLMPNLRQSWVQTSRARTVLPCSERRQRAVQPAILRASFAVGRRCEREIHQT